MYFYDLKRTAARGLRKQVDEQTAMAVMGQKTPAVFQRYRIVDVEDKAEALKTLAACLDPALRTSGHQDVLWWPFAYLEPKPERNRRVGPTRLDPPTATPQFLGAP